MSRDGHSSADIDGMPVERFARITGVPVGFLMFRRELGDDPYVAAAMWRMQRLKEIGRISLGNERSRRRADPNLTHLWDKWKWFETGYLLLGRGFSPRNFRRLRQTLHSIRSAKMHLCDFA